MSRELKKYKREQHAYADKQQTRLGFADHLEPSEMQKAKTETGIDYTQQVMCPFCLHQDKLQAFLVSTKKGISQSKANCPECHNGMMLRNLTADWTPEQYAEFCYGYARTGFWDKVPFTKWKERLSDIGWAIPFWNKYKSLKADNQDMESYDAFIQRKQKEEYEHGAQE